MKNFLTGSRMIPGLIIGLCTFYACQKEGARVTETTVPNTTTQNVHDRMDHLYGVTPASPGVPSLVVTMIRGTSGGAIYAITPYLLLGGGQSHSFEDLRGVCTVNGQVFVTTGPSEVDAYNNLLLKVDPFTGQAGIISQSNIGTVSDIDYDENTGTIYGLRNNTNTLVSITDNGNNWGSYAPIGAITGLGNDYVAKGLSMVRDGNGDRLVVAATRDNGGDAQLYELPATAGAANLLSVIKPSDQLATGHCGIGYDQEYKLLLINRIPSGFGSGLNSVNWDNPLPNPSNSTEWGTYGLEFEDVSTILQ